MNQLDMFQKEEYPPVELPVPIPQVPGQLDMDYIPDEISKSKVVPMKDTVQKEEYDPICSQFGCQLKVVLDRCTTLEAENMTLKHKLKMEEL